MLVRECMTKNVQVITPQTTILEAAKRMRDGDFGALPIGEGDKLEGMITDRDIAIRAVAEGKNPDKTRVSEVMSRGVLYCYDDQDISEVSRNMGDNQTRRLPVLNRQKRLVGILSLGDLAISKNAAEGAKEALSQISRHEHNEQRIRERVSRAQGLQ